jgi:WD40 repeat protein
LNEVPTFNYLEEDKFYVSDKPYPNSPTVRSILKISDDLIAIGTNLGEIDCWSESSNMRVWTTKEHASFIYTMAKLCEDSMFVSGEFTEQGVAIVWEFTNTTSTIKKKVSLENSGIWVLCVINPDLIACGMENSNILIWDLNNKFVYKRKEESKPTGKNGKKSFKQKSTEYNTLNIKNKISTHTGYVKSLIYIKNKDLLLSGGSDCKIVTTKLSNSGFSTSELFNTEHTGIILSFCYFLEEYLASSDDIGVIKIWRFDQRNSIRTIQVHLNAVTQLIYSEPKMILSSSLDKNIHFISIDNNFNFSVIKTIKTREPVWSMIHSPAHKSFTAISFNSCFITTYS